jgi:hypothetical protein
MKRRKRRRRGEVGENAKYACIHALCNFHHYISFKQCEESKNCTHTRNSLELAKNINIIFSCHDKMRKNY